MGLRVALDAELLSDKGIWTAEIPHGEKRHFGRPLASQGDRNVIGVISPEFADGTLYFDLANAIVLNEGETEETLILDLADEPASSETLVHRLAGDDSFRAAATGLLAPEMSMTAHAILDGIRNEFKGELVAVQGRKWVHSPANFVALTIQNRDQSIAITVRGEPEKHPNTPLHLKRDRPGYSRFKVTSPSEVGRAMMHIRCAARLYEEGRSSEPLRRV